VKRAVVKVIVVLAHKDVIHNNEGAKAFHFIIKNCQLGGTSDDFVELRQTCRDSLVLVSTTAPQVAPVLAPLLLKCFLLPEYLPIAGFLARCLALLQTREPIDKSKTPEVVAKCLVLIGAPFPEVGVYTLQFVKALSLCFEGDLAKALETGAARLIENLQGILNFETILQKKTNQTGFLDIDWSESSWEVSLLKFMKELVKTLTDAMWVAEFADAIVKLGQQDLNPANRNAQLSCLVSLAVYRKDAALASNLIQEALAVAKLSECEKVSYFIL